MLSHVDLTLISESSKSNRVEKQLSQVDDEVTFATQSVLISRTEKVILIGKLSNPTLACSKSIYNPKYGQTVIPLAVKKTVAVQKFKMPFRTVDRTIDSETEFEFIFIRSVKPTNPTLDTFEFQNNQFKVFENIAFFC